MNRKPLVGILCVGIAYRLNEEYGSQFKSYIAASYVKFLEGAGARIIPIWIGKDQEYYEEIMKRINGILLPGGAVFFNEPKGYAEAGRIIYKIAVEMNNAGAYMPLWGTCLGFELLTYASINGREHRQDCDAIKICSMLDFKTDFKDSRLFKDIPDDIFYILSNEAVTFNFHKYCISEEDFIKYELNNDWKVMSLNKDRNGLEYISTIEHKKYPFYGVQFHPEKNAYEYLPDMKSLHTKNGIRASQYFAEFFVNETRKSQNQFKNENDENSYLIYNYPITFTGLKLSQWQQCYLFLENVSYF